MAGAPHPFLLFLLLVSQPRDTSPAIVLYPRKLVTGILGESVVLQLASEKMVKRITWFAPSPRQDALSGKARLAVVTPGEGGTLPRLAVENERYRGRLRLHGWSYSLEISNLTMADEGEYGVEQTLVGQSQYRGDYSLLIYKRLSELEIRVRPVMVGNSTCNVTFTCSAGEQAMHTWTRPAGGAVLSTEESLLVQHRLGAEDSPVTCIAKNPVSNSSANASPKAACEGTAPPQTSGLSYCCVKGILVLGMLGTLLAGILTVHLLTMREQRWP